MAERDAFVARDRELQQLQAYLDGALEGKGQICFVVGEAGSGKTTLVSEFTRRAQERHGDLVAAMGQCDAQSGMGDAYLPFREILDLLTGDVDAKVAQGSISNENATRLQKMLQLSGETLIEVAPDLIGLFVPWAGLIMRLGTLAAERGGLADKLRRWTQRHGEQEVPGSAGIDQGQIFEQYVNLLRALALRQPLLLILDDLQWADTSSIGLLFRLGRRIEQSRILVVGTYRPEEVALGRAGERHPLQKPLAEFKRYLGDISVNLDQAKEGEGRRFVDALLDAEPNRMGEGFRQALYQHTSGHPLFTVELLRDMQERGDIILDEQNRWAEGPSLDWTALPARVEGIIEERMGRLEDELREMLNVASVEGEQFTAEVIARVRDVEARRLVRRLSGELEKQHLLIAALGTQRVGSTRMSRYRFLHSLFQDYLYSALDEVERPYLHEDVGNALEELYGDDSAEIAVSLAHHFVQADLREKARHYLGRAGEQAAARFANEEAVRHISRALDLTPDEKLAERCHLLLLRERVYDVRGERSAQVQDLSDLEKLAAALDDPARRSEVSLRRAQYAEATSDYATAVAEAHRAIELAQAAQDARRQGIGHLQWGRALWHQGDYEAAQTQLEQALALARDHRLPLLESDCLSNLGLVAWYQGAYAGGTAFLEQALLIKQELDDRQGEGHVLTNLAGVAYEQGRHAQAMCYQESALQFYRQNGDRRGEGMSLSNLGGFLSEQGRYTEAKAQLLQALPIYRDIGDREGESAALINLGIVSLYEGCYDHSRDHLERSLYISHETGDRRGEVEAQVYLSLLHHHQRNDEAARAAAQMALAIAQETGDRRNESHALTHLGHALAGLGQLEEAARAYQEALTQRRRAGEQHRAMETLAGLARMSLAQGDLARAFSQVEDILSFLSTATLAGTDEPFRVYLTCYRVLQASQDQRAVPLLATAHDLLQARAGQIGDAQTRRSYLENFSAHREIVKEWELRIGRP